MRVFVSTWLMLLVSVLVVPKTGAQDSSSAPGTPAGEFFSGYVVAFQSTEITVSRKALGQGAAAVKTFAIDSNTKMEGTLKIKAQVTVRFINGEGTPRALHIIVR